MEEIKNKYNIEKPSKTNENKDKLNNKIKSNVINIIIEIDKQDINKEIYFLDNVDYFDEDIQTKHYHDNLQELDKSNTELYINDEKYDFQKYFIPQKQGKHSIKLIFNICIKNCSYMFYECKNITSIDLSSFDTSNVANMSYMFAYCYKLQKINLLSFYTKKVIDMNYMFAYCHNLCSIDLSSFCTMNVINMNSMFAYCYVLKNLDLSSFDTSNVTNMGYMFSNCENLINLDLSYFNTEKVVNMGYMFSSCYKLTYLDLSHFNANTANTDIIINGIFFPCSNLKKIKMNKNFYKVIESEINKNIQIIFI